MTLATDWRFKFRPIDSQTYQFSLDHPASACCRRGHGHFQQIGSEGFGVEGRSNLDIKCLFDQSFHLDFTDSGIFWHWKLSSVVIGFGPRLCHFGQSPISLCT